MRRLLLLIGVIGIGMLLLLDGGLMSRLWPVMPEAPVDFATLKRPPTQNQYLVCPPGLCAADAESPICGVGVDRLEAAFRRAMRTERRLSLVDEGGSTRQLEYVQRSAFWRFPDRISVRFLKLPDGRATLAIYSRSIYGRGDMGVNRRRVERWLALLQAELRASNT